MKDIENQLDLINYIKWRGDLTLKQDPFNDIDGIIFSQLAYMDFSGLLDTSFEQEKPVGQVCAEYFALKDVESRNNIGAMINKKIPLLFKAVAESKRFGNLKLCAFVNIMDSDAEEQFSAVTFKAEGFSILAIRGTDDTLLGWKEDMNLLYTEEIPSYEAASSYFYQAAKALKGKFIISGHSKGGNTAIIAASRASAGFKKRLAAIYNADGTGCPKAFFETENYKQIQDKIHSFYPAFGVVGMIFEHPENFKIVESVQFAAMQHDPLSWKVIGKEFVQAKDFTDESKMFHVSINSWIESMDAATKKKFINLLFDVILAGGARTNTEIENNSLSCGAKMLAKLSSLEESDRKYVIEIIQMLLKGFKDNLPMLNVFNLKESVKIDLHNLFEKAKEKGEQLEAEIRELLKPKKEENGKIAKS